MPPQVCTYEGKRERGGRLNVPRVNNGRAGAAAAAAAAASSSFARSFVRFAQFMFFSVKTQNRFHFASKPTGARVAATASPRPRRRRRWPRPRNRLTAAVRSLARSFVRSPPSPRSTFNHAPDILHVRPRRPPKHRHSLSFSLS